MKNQIWHSSAPSNSTSMVLHLVHYCGIICIIGDSPKNKSNKGGSHGIKFDYRRLS